MRSSIAGVPFTALELVLEEIHLRRRASLRGWQEMDDKRSQRDSRYSHHPRRRRFYIFSDDAGKDLERLSRVHSSWTSISRHILGRILILSDLSLRSAKAAASAPTLGEWTREVYLSFSRDYNESEEIWDAIARVLSRTPAILVFSVQTASRVQYCIHLCVKKLSGTLSEFTQLRTLRLYSDVAHGVHEHWSQRFLRIAEHQSLFHALERSPHFECLMLRNFLPCYKIMDICKSEKDDSEEEDYPELPDPPDPLVMAKKVEGSSSLTGRIHSLAEFIRSICNTPMETTRERVWSTGNVMTFAAFVLNPTSQQFYLNAAQIIKRTDGSVEAVRPPSFKYEEWCNNLESLDITSELVVFKSLRPFPSLKFLRAFISSTYSASSLDVLRGEVNQFVSCLPPTLEVLDFLFVWEVPDALHSSIPLDILDELDGILVKIPSVQCPNLKVLVIIMDYVSAVKMPLKRLISSCEKLGIPLVLHGWEFKEDCHGVHDRQEINHLLEFNNHI